MEINVSLERDDVVVPVRANPSDAGLDIFFNPEGGERVTIGPNSSMLLPTGCRFGIPHGYMLQVCNRSSIACRRSLVVGAHIIDAGFSGEVFVNLHNVGKTDQTIRAGDKIAQLVMLPVVNFTPKLCSEQKLYEGVKVNSERGAGCLGSTDSLANLHELDKRGLR